MLHILDNPRNKPGPQPFTSAQLIASFWARVDRNGGPEACWPWLGGRTKGGYGSVGDGKTTTTAHRLAYMLKHGDPGPTKQIDHLCRTRICVNDKHLEAVSCRTNLLRGETITARRHAQTDCIHGHPFDSKNTYIRINGTRSCRACDREAHRKISLCST